ncbi:hypothetical protein [Piscirickettsia salmonis]|nr:hypothetical protein [Piscirickettsia salmonis]
MEGSFSNAFAGWSKARPLFQMLLAQCSMTWPPKPYQWPPVAFLKVF